MGVFIPDRARPSRAQLAKLALHLRLDIERVLAAPDTPLVAGDHELANLISQGVVPGRGGRARERRHLRLDVERRLAAGPPARRLCPPDLPGPARAPGVVAARDRRRDLRGGARGDRLTRKRPFSLQFGPNRGLPGLASA